jgi:hypothetical protein
MNSRDLTCEQAEALLKQIWPTLGYLNRVRARMEQRHFPSDDRLYRMVVAARDRIHELTVELHYMSCRQGVGRPARHDQHSR